MNLLYLLQPVDILFVYFLHQQIEQIGDCCGSHLFRKLEPLNASLAVDDNGLPGVCKDQMDQSLQFDIELAPHRKNLNVLMHIVLLPLKYPLLRHFALGAAHFDLVLGVFRIVA